MIGVARAVPKEAALAFLVAGAALFPLSFVLALLPMETQTSCHPDGYGGEICGSSIGPGPLARVGGFLFFLGWLLPVVGLFVLSVHASTEAAQILAILAASLLAALLLIVTFYLMVTTL